jgi:putative ABC transport system substrate-binding protein
VKRLDFITLLGGAAAWPLAARAQQPGGMRRIGVLMSTAADDPEGKARFTAFKQGLQQLGWDDGRNTRVETRWSGGKADDVRRYAAELVALAPDVILASGGAVVGPLLQVTRTVPIVFTQTPDPVAAGFVASLARPGGNATGFTQVEYGMATKWLELLKEIAPRVTRVAVLRDPAVPEGIGQFAVIQSVAPALRVEVSPVDIRNAGEIERAATEFARSGNGGLIVTSSPVGKRSSRTDHQACLQTPAARSVLVPLLRERWRPRRLRVRFDRSTPARGELRRPHPQGREAGRPSGAGPDQVRACDQRQDRQGARAHGARSPARARRLGRTISLIDCRHLPPIWFAVKYRSLLPAAAQPRH